MHTYSPSSGGGRPETRSQRGRHSEGPPQCADLCPHGAEGARELCGLLYKAVTPFWRAPSSWLRFLPAAPPPPTLGVRISSSGLGAWDHNSGQSSGLSVSSCDWSMSLPGLIWTDSPRQLPAFLLKGRPCVVEKSERVRSHRRSRRPAHPLSPPRGPCPMGHRGLCLSLCVFPCFLDLRSSPFFPLPCW